MQAMDKYLRGAWYDPHGGGIHVKYVGTKKRSANGEDLNTLVNSAMVNVVKMTNKSKAKKTLDSENDNEANHYNFKHLKIVSDSKNPQGSAKSTETVHATQF